MVSTIIFRSEEDIEDIEEVEVDDDFMEHVKDVAKCICCRNNWDDPDGGHSHSEC